MYAKIAAINGNFTQGGTVQNSVELYIIKQRIRWLTPLMSAESKSLSSSLSAFPSENSVDSFITLIRRIVFLTILPNNTSGIERNSKRKSRKKWESVSWGGPQNGRISDAFWSFSESLYCTSLCYISMFPTRAVSRAQISACSIAVLR